MQKGIVLPESKAERMEFVYRYMCQGVRLARSLAPKEWLLKRGLSIEMTEAGFNSGQIHHRQSLEFKKALVEIGFMFQSNAPVNCETVPYTVFGIFSVMFPLRNVKNEIVNFYSVRIKSDHKAYMNQEPGLYPRFPHEMTKRLFVVNTILDAATLLESRILDNREAVLALHDGKFMAEHEEAIKRLKVLEEVVYIDSPIEKQKKEKAYWVKSKNGVNRKNTKHNDSEKSI